MTADEFTNALKTLGLSQVQFAAMTETTRVSVGRWARGEQSVPGMVSMIVRLMAATDVWRSWHGSSNAEARPFVVESAKDNLKARKPEVDRAAIVASLNKMLPSLVDKAIERQTRRQDD
jgi:hypothetical protein